MATMIIIHDLSNKILQQQAFPIFVIESLSLLSQGKCSLDVFHYLRNIIQISVYETHITEDVDLHLKLTYESNIFFNVLLALESYLHKNPYHKPDIYDLLPFVINKAVARELLKHPKIDPVKLSIMSGDIQLLCSSFHARRGNNFNAPCSYFSDSRCNLTNNYKLLLTVVCTERRFPKIKLKRRISNEIVSRLLLLKLILNNDIYNYILISGIF